MTFVPLGGANSCIPDAAMWPNKAMLRTGNRRAENGNSTSSLLITTFFLGDCIYSYVFSVTSSKV